MSILEFKAEDLPSRGVTYPEGTIFTLQKFSYGEVQDLNLSNLSIESKIEMFNKALSINTELKHEDLAYLDYIFMHLSRVASVYNNNRLRVPTICPYCSKPMTHDVNLSDLQLNDIAQYADIIPFTQEIGGQEFKFNFLTTGKIIKWFRLINNIQQYEAYVDLKKQHEEMRIEIEKISSENPNQVLQAKWEALTKQFNELNGKMTKKNQSRAIKYKEYGMNSLLLAFMCSDFGSEEFDQFLTKVLKAQGEEIEFLDFVETTLGEGLKPLKITCEHCAKIYSVSLEDNVNDVYPFRRSSTDIANELRVREKAKSATEPVKE
jgi:hypothetical protein